MELICRSLSSGFRGQVYRHLNQLTPTRTTGSAILKHMSPSTTAYLNQPYRGIGTVGQVDNQNTTSIASHAHDRLWKAERYLSLGLLGVLPAAAVIPHPIMDYAVALSVVVHVHWGVEAIVTDYIRPSIFGPVVPKLSVALVYILSSLTLGGLFVFNYTDVGISQATRMIARI